MTPRMHTHMHGHTRTHARTHTHMHAQYTIFHLMYCSLSVKYLNKPNGRFKYRMVSLVLLYHATYHIMYPVMSFDGRHLENPGMPEGSGSTWNNIWKESRRCKHIKSTGWKAAVQRSHSLYTGVELEDYTRFLTRGKGCGKRGCTRIFTAWHAFVCAYQLYIFTVWICVFEWMNEIIYLCRYSKDVDRNNGNALTIAMLTHSLHTTKVAKIRRYTMLSTMLSFKMPGCTIIQYLHTLNARTYKHTLNAYIKCQDVQTYIKCVH